MTLDEFDKITESWLICLDDVDDEFYTSEHDFAVQVFETIRQNVFGQEIQKQQRMELYLELKAEFEPEKS